jgi:hypothetical protein
MFSVLQRRMCDYRFGITHNHAAGCNFPTNYHISTTTVLRWKDLKWFTEHVEYSAASLAIETNPRERERERESVRACVCVCVCEVEQSVPLSVRLTLSYEQYEYFIKSRPVLQFRQYGACVSSCGALIQLQTLMRCSAARAQWPCITCTKFTFFPMHFASCWKIPRKRSSLMPRRLRVFKRLHIQSRFSRPEPLLFLPSSSSVVLTRLSGPRSRPTTSKKIW